MTRAVFHVRSKSAGRFLWLKKLGNSGGRAVLAGCRKANPALLRQNLQFLRPVRPVCQRLPPYAVAEFSDYDLMPALPRIAARRIARDGATRA